MKHDTKYASPLPDFQIDVELLDGRHGVFDMRPYLHRPGLSALRDPAYFNRVSVLYGALTWPGGEDIAPETVAAELKLHAPA